MQCDDYAVVRGKRAIVEKVRQQGAQLVIRNGATLRAHDLQHDALGQRIAQCTTCGRWNGK